MKQLKRIITVFLIALPFGANADLLFEDDFESGSLIKWTGKDSIATNSSGVIVPDPTDPDNNNVLTFKSDTWGGDMFSANAFNPETNIFKLSFWYLGRCESHDCGGYVGYSEGFPDDHTSLYATGIASGAADVLVDNFKWAFYEFTFNSASALRIMLEDYEYSTYAEAGDAYFDDIRLTDGREVSVPEPGTLALFGIGILAMGAARRKKKA